MITFKDIVEAGIKIQEQMTNVVVYSEVKNIEDLSIEDLKRGNYYADIIETYDEEAIKNWYFELKDGRGITFTIIELEINLERMDNVEEFKELVGKLYDKKIEQARKNLNK